MRSAQGSALCERLKFYVLLCHEFHITSRIYLRITLHPWPLMEPIIRLVFHSLVRLGRLLKFIYSRTKLPKYGVTVPLPSNGFAFAETVNKGVTRMSPLPSNLILLDESEFESR